jgi:hypothetical protein
MDGPRIRAWLGHASLDTTNRTSSSDQRAAGLSAGREHVPLYVKDQRPVSHVSRSRCRNRAILALFMAAFSSLARWPSGCVVYERAKRFCGLSSSTFSPNHCRNGSPAGDLARHSGCLAVLASGPLELAGGLGGPRGVRRIPRPVRRLVAVEGPRSTEGTRPRRREREDLGQSDREGQLALPGADGRHCWTRCRPLSLVIGAAAGRGAGMVWASRGGECDVVGGGDEHVLSRFARIQDDRGHIVVTSGPYGYVRHPMYAGVIVLFLCIPLVLGSWLALLPGAANAVLMVIRARQEDRMLRAELGGYEAYAHRVRYRLLPGVW